MLARRGHFFDARVSGRRPLLSFALFSHSSSLAGLRHRSLHVLGAVDPLCGEKIVSSAQKANITRVGSTPPPRRHFVIELQVCRRLAAPAIRRGERTGKPVSGNDGAPRSTRDAPLFRGPPLDVGSTRSSELLLLDLSDERIERPLDDNREISPRIAVA